MGVEMPVTIPLYGRKVPVGDYETLRSLEHVAFGLTSSLESEAKCHRVAVEAAIAALVTMRAVVRK